MTVYIEYVIIDNLAITYLISILSMRFMRVRINRLLALVVATIGTVVAVFYPFVTLDSFWLVAFKLSTGVLLGLLLFVRTKKKLMGTLTFFVVTFLYGGALVFVGMLLMRDFESALTSPITNVPIGLIIATAFLIYYVIRRLSVRFHKTNDGFRFVRSFEVELWGRKIAASGFLDSGNRLYDNDSGLPIVVIGLKAFFALCDDAQLHAIITHNCKTLGHKSHMIQFSSCTGQSKPMLVLQPDSFRLYSVDKKNIVYEVMLGVSSAKLGDTINYDAILHSSFI